MRFSELREKPSSRPPQPAKTKSRATKIIINLVGMVAVVPSYGTSALGLGKAKASLGSD